MWWTFRFRWVISSLESLNSHQVSYYIDTKIAFLPLLQAEIVIKEYIMLKIGHFKGYIMLGSSFPRPLTRTSSRRSWGGRTPAWPSPPSDRCWVCPRSWWRWGHTAPALTSPAVSCTCKQRQFSLYYTLHPGIEFLMLPVNVVRDERSIEGNTEPFSGQEEEEVEEDVEDVLRQHLDRYCDNEVVKVINKLITRGLRLAHWSIGFL